MGPFLFLRFPKGGGAGLPPPESATGYELRSGASLAADRQTLRSSEVISALVSKYVRK